MLNEFNVKSHGWFYGTVSKREIIANLELAWYWTTELPQRVERGLPVRSSTTLSIAATIRRDTVFVTSPDEVSCGDDSRGSANLLHCLNMLCVAHLKTRLEYYSITAPCS